jgi:hypothetical protein
MTRCSVPPVHVEWSDVIMETSAPQGKPNKRALYRFSAAILISFGLFFIIPSQIEINRAKQAENWIPRKAKITHSNIRQFGGGRAHDIARYVPDIRGAFLDNNETFEVFRVSFAKVSNKSLAEGYVNRFSEGAIVEVYVSPTAPHKVVLIKDVSVTQMYIMEAIGGLLIALAVLSLGKSRNYSTRT